MIDINVEGLARLAVFESALADAVLDDLAEASRAKWIQLAQQRLGSTKRDYINGIQPVEVAEGGRLLVLFGSLPNMVETGAEAWDLRSTLLTGPKVKTSAEGKRYRSIPFRHGTPGSQGQGGTPMGARYGPQGSNSRAWASGGAMDRGQAGKLGDLLYRAAKGLRKGRSLGDRTGGATVLGKGPDAVRVPKLAPWHSTDIFAGMKRVRKSYANEKTGKTTTQSHYMTFRTISEANPTGWIHPGIQARNLHRDVEEYAKSIAGKLLDVALNKALR